VTWFKVDDTFYRSRKVRRLGKDRVPCVGLWTLCGDWSADNLTDGFVPWEIVEDWDEDRRWAVRLIQAALWFETEHDGEHGVQFHDWADWQPTRDQVVQRRKADAERRARWRDAKRHASPDAVTEAASPVSSRSESRSESREVSRRDTRRESRPGSVLPDPTRPDPSLKTPSLAPLADGDDPFEAFWQAYPRRVERRAAEKAWRAALKRKTTPEQIITAARAYADRTRDTEPRFVKHPASWLNAGAYDDERPTASVQALWSFEQLREQAAATEAARLLRIPYIPAPQPPSDRTPPQQWLHDRAVEFIAAHEHELRAALTERKTG
jgi:hypothetical protein